MSRVFPCLAAALGACMFASTQVHAQSAPRAIVPANFAPLVTPDKRIAASLDRIARRSELWRLDLNALRGTARYAFVLTPKQVITINRQVMGKAEAFDLTVLAEVSPVIATDASVSAVLVVVNLELLDRLHDRRRSLPVERDADLDRILVHEVYGHAFPYLRAGDLSGQCPDPIPGERATSACSVVRENAVRAELGLGHRADYGLNSLFLSR